MAPSSPILRRGLIEYDAARRRLWLCGQRCHHGATGAFLAVAAVGAAVTSRIPTRGLTTLIATGGLLMVHDWNDRSIWFEPGRGSQQ